MSAARSKHCWARTYDERNLICGKWTREPGFTALRISSRKGPPYAWLILRLQPCRYVDCLICEHWGWLPERYATEEEALADARQFSSGEPWLRPTFE